MYQFRFFSILSALIMPVTPGFGQTSLSNEKADITVEEIVVSAQKREALLHQTPLAMSAFGKKYLKDSQIARPVDIGHRTPGFSLYELSPMQSAISIRGAFTSDGSPGTDQPVAMFVDDVYLGRPSDVRTDLFGLERIEILRGPQGTLFGRNAVGGVINFITRNPGAEKDAEFDLTIGNLNRRMIRGYLSTPISETLFANVTFKIDRQDGWARNLFTGNDAEGKDISSARGKLKWIPSDDLEVIFAVDASKDRGEGIYGGFLSGDPELFPNISSYDENVSLQSFDGELSKDVWGTSARVVWSLDILGDNTTLTSITAWRQGDATFKDTDLGPSDVQNYYFNAALTDTDDEQFTQELRLAGGSERWTWVGGLYYLWGSHDRRGVLDISAAPAGTAFHDIWGDGVFTDNEYQRVDTNSIAIFGQGTFSLTAHWSITGGLRWTYDEKDMRSTGISGAGLFILEDFEVSDSDYWDAITPMASIQGAFENLGSFDSLFVYASATKGYKAGGYNVQAGTAAGIAQSVQPEFVWNYEVGIKTRSMDNRLSADVIVYHQVLEDLQTQVFAQGGTFSQENAGKTIVDGIEIELSAALGERFDLGISYSRMNGRYDMFISNATDFSDQRLPQSPETTYSIDAIYVLPVSNGELSLRANFSHNSWINITPRLDNDPYPIKARTERDTLDIFLNYQGKSWSIGLYGRNLTDDRPITFSLDSLSFGWLTLNELDAGEQAWFGRIGPPREYGVTIGWRM